MHGVRCACAVLLCPFSYAIDERVGLFAACLIILIVGFRFVGLLCLLRSAGQTKGKQRCR